MAKFTNKPKGRTSKRLALNKKYKIEKKVKQHHKKLKKEARKMSALGQIKKTSSKEIGIPNMYPFKKNVIETLKRKKDQEEQEKKIQKLQQKEELDLNLAEVKSNLYETKAQVVVEEEQIKQENLTQLTKEHKKYITQVKKVAEAADILLIILDARDPLACRCKHLEREILGMPGDKKIILAMQMHGWLICEREFATVLFKANTQQQQSNLSSASIYKKTLSQRQDLADDLTSSSKAIGADKLLELIKNYSKNDGVKSSVTVGVIGYPNVGKSSVINSLKRSKACAVSSTPGFTKGLQEVVIDSQVKIIDCPGVVFDSENKESTLLRNIIKIEQIEDPREPIGEILKKVSKNELLLLYKIQTFNNLNEFLCQVALARGKLQKGGIPDLDCAARIVLQDWNQGKIKYFTVPPNQIEQE
ncbi:unnamed protein product (macronuclear) [Paramecium tetraurelia]|uniref:CP-type G domain-containing protein n=1 Tax=Paramecium tetraurelia TaxID=5888 RepID=A0BXK3_PARTE|nr:uncharacterized protein GSPATT00033123001 [Paramecium tetraurelia]CAK63270.1 unnamed protein product [Paramecium tetraurelia]|eukprot:XP_001430668.1 hypothetical protein (macronuclear) [Paramecium tetraurelia strain d4-2]